MPKILAFIDGSIYSDSVCDHAIWAAARDQVDVSLFNVIEGVIILEYHQIFLEILKQKSKINYYKNYQSLTKKDLNSPKGKLVFFSTQRRTG